MPECEAGDAVRGQATVREVTSELERLGLMRREANEALEAAAAGGAELLPRALAAGLSKTRIAGMLGVTRQTLNEWEARARAAET